MFVLFEVRVLTNLVSASACELSPIDDVELLSMSSFSILLVVEPVFVLGVPVDTGDDPMLPLGMALIARMSSSELLFAGM